ncbi:uncharacterized protein J3R85_007871 [Psidium guajava]|nr:uncharacterized protein J3R85_007871 [Psidium guajava]
MIARHLFCTGLRIPHSGTPTPFSKSFHSAPHENPPETTTV